MVTLHIFLFSLLLFNLAKKKAKAATSGTQTTGRRPIMDLIQMIQGSNTNAGAAAGEPENVVSGGRTERPTVADRCAIHTSSFPGLCSPDCYEIMEAIGTLVDTHTPLCPTGCDLRHHLLTSAVFNPSITFRACEDFMPVTFKLCIQACFSSGWGRGMDVPEPLESLRYPLLHLLCLGGHSNAVTKLIEDMKFSLSVSCRSKETPLHVAARYFPVTFPEVSRSKKIARFKGVLDVIIEQKDDMLFMVDSNGDTVLHVLAKGFCAASNIVLKNCSSISNDRSCFMKQKCHYFKAMKLFLETLADLDKRDRVCKKAVCKVVHDCNNASKTFWNILEAGHDKAMLRVLNMHANDVLPFCFGEVRSHLLNSPCRSDCPCQGSADLQSRGCQTQLCLTEGLLLSWNL